MGTRSLIHFKDDYTVLCTIYRQFDGYPEGRGKELADFLKGKKIVDGIPSGEPTDGLADGPGCLAAQWIAHEKDDVGGVYMWIAGDGCELVDYVYTVTVKDFQVTLQCTDGEEVLFNGAPSEFDAFLTKLNEEA